MGIRTITADTTPRRRLGQTAIVAPDGPPADYAGPAGAQDADARWDAAHEAAYQEGRDEMAQLIAEQAADAEADGIEFGAPVTADDARATTGRYEVPEWKVSATGDTESFAKAPKLTELRQHGLETYPEFKRLGKFKFLVLWKAKGGTRAGEPVIAKTTLLGGLARYHAQAHFLITFAADHCHELKLTDAHYEAAMYHELCHCHWTVNDDGTEKAKLQHGIEVFPGELERFGIWRADLARVKDAMTQQRLWEAENQMAEGVL